MACGCGGSRKIDSFYAFLKGFATLGVGTGNLGFRRSQTIPADVVYLGPQWNVQRSLGPLPGPGYMMLEQRVVPVSVRGSGLGIQGQYVLQSLGQEAKADG